jgi:chromosome partitioning protein
MPANLELSGMEVSLVNAMSREKVLKQYLDSVNENTTLSFWTVCRRWVC